jgi:hypothetical protein
MNSDDGNQCSHWLGSPIRTFPDHRLLAPPRDFSQLATSFFAYLRLGIPTHALSSLTIKLTPFTESVFVVLVFLPKRVLDAIASAPLPIPLFQRNWQVNLLHPLNCAFQWNARQIFNCQRSRKLQQLSINRRFYETKPFIEGCCRLMVGLGRLELPTSPLSGVRSNHLSYRPIK